MIRHQPQRVVLVAPVGSLFKRPLKTRTTINAFRAPRCHDEGHLAAIRQCPCLKCGLNPAGEAAHVRMGSGVHHKRNTGLGEKPDDCWAVPLCPSCHREDPQSQHRIGELSFWNELGINPLPLCEKLYAASPDIVKMRAICFVVIAERKG